MKMTRLERLSFHLGGVTYIGWGIIIYLIYLIIKTKLQ